MNDNDNDNTNRQLLNLYNVKNNPCWQLRDLGTTKPSTYFLFSSLHPGKLSPQLSEKSVARRQCSASENHHTKNFLVLVSLKLNNEKILCSMLTSSVDYVLAVRVIVWLVQESRIFQKVVIKSQIVSSTAEFSPTASDEQYKQQKRENRTDDNKGHQETCKRKRRDLAPVYISGTRTEFLLAL